MGARKLITLSCGTPFSTARIARSGSRHTNKSPVCPQNLIPTQMGEDCNLEWPSRLHHGVPWG
jgi:hypothetical protein